MAGLRALCVIATAWVAATCIASQAGSSYVRATADCLTPVLLCQAATLAGLHAARRWQQQQQQHRGPAAAAAPADAQQPHAGWHLALAALNVLGGALTLASFALSSVSFTYIVRTLEPLCSCVLLAAVQLRQPCSPTEFVLLLLVATSTCCVVSRDAAHAAQDMSSLAGMVAGGSAGGGSGSAAAALAFVATLTVSCRSVASKVMAAATSTSPFQHYLQSAAPGVLLAAVLQLAASGAAGLPLPPRAATPHGTLPAAALLACALFTAAYQAASFKVLQHCPPLVHGMLNASKRVAIVLVAALASGRQLTPWQQGWLLVANAAAAALVRRHAPVEPAAGGGGGGMHALPSSCGGGERGAAAAAAAWPAAAAAAGAGAGGAHKAGAGGARDSRAAVMPRLMRVIACVVIVAGVGLAYVVAALSAGGVHTAVQQQQQQQVPCAPGSSSQHLGGGVGGGSNAGGSNAGAPQLRTNGGQHSSSNGQHSNSSGLTEAAAAAFALRDSRRTKCLADLQRATKALFQPYLDSLGAGSLRGVALFDVPLHANLGDGVLSAAAARLVPQFHTAIKYTCALSQYPVWHKAQYAAALKHFPRCDVQAMREAIGPDGVVLIAPGGNWGDLWWHVHSKRLEYLQQMASVSADVRAAHATAAAAAAAAAGEPAVAASSAPGFQVVQLPQSIAFRGNETAAHDAAAIAALPRGMLTLMVRAADSLAYARRRYGSNVDVLPAPDVAWSLGALMPGSDGPVADVLVLLRADHEAAPAEAAVLAAAAARGHAHAAAAVEDAKPRNNTPAASTRAHAAHAALAQLRASGHTYELRDWGFAGANLTRELSQTMLGQLAESRLQAAVDIISRGKVVVTNRLHAAVVANLVGRPLIWIDTAQKKISGVRSLAFSHSTACTEAHMHSRQAGDLAEAVALAQQWLGSQDFVWSLHHQGPGAAAQ